MPHIVLFGDSIFDNKSYVDADGKDVVAHLRQIISDDWGATLKAIDGAVIEGVSRQFQDVPTEATHFVISVGGNNAIRNADILEMRAGSAAQVFSELAKRKDVFESQYREMLRQVLSKNIPTAVCTIYYPNFPDTVMQKLARQNRRAFQECRHF